MFIFFYYVLCIFVMGPYIVGGNGLVRQYSIV